jgi:hypothetical protein
LVEIALSSAPGDFSHSCPAEIVVVIPEGAVAVLSISSGMWLGWGYGVVIVAVYRRGL